MLWLTAASSCAKVGGRVPHQRLDDCESNLAVARMQLKGPNERLRQLGLDRERPHGNVVAEQVPDGAGGALRNLCVLGVEAEGSCDGREDAP